MSSSAPILVGSPPLGGRHLLPGDHLNFSFSPSSPPGNPDHLTYGQPTFPHFLSSTSPPPPNLSNISTTSSVSPSLFSPHSAASTASISQSIAHNLGPLSPPRAESPMDEDVGILASPGGGNGNNKRAMGAEEDALRRGPPTSDTPGGDCKSLCLRHQRMANGGTNLMLQKVRVLTPLDSESRQTCFAYSSLLRHPVHREPPTARPDGRQHHLVPLLFLSLSSTTPHPPRSSHHCMSLPALLPPRCPHVGDATRPRRTTPSRDWTQSVWLPRCHFTRTSGAG